MNHQTDQIYIAVKNDPELLQDVFKGIFVCARRFTGYSPSRSSFPFISGSEATAASTLLGTYTYKGREEFPFVVRLQHLFTDRICKRLVRVGMGQSMADDIIRNLEPKELVSELFKEYWEDMLLYATYGKVSMYKSNWQAVVANIKAEKNLQPVSKTLETERVE